MFYTDAMLRNEKKNSTVLIFTGLILLLLGIIGILYLVNTQQSKAPKGAYRYFEKGTITLSDLTPTLINNQPTETFDNGTTTSSTVSNFNIQEIRPFKSFIHSSNSKLENPEIPDRIEIPSIKLVAPVVISDFNVTKIEGETFGQWIAPSRFAAGWHPDSALLGEKGNTVINGHHNEFGEVFGNLVDVKIGDLIIVSSGNQKFEFVVSNRMILAERFQSTAVRLDNARWLAKTDDIRLTLVTCYPKESNTHRLIIVARPITN